MKNSILRRGQRITFHPLIFAAFPILSLFVHNMSKGYLREAALITAGALVLCLLLWLLLNLLVKDAERSALVISAFFFLFFFFGHARSAVELLFARLNLQDQGAILVHGSRAASGWLVLWGLLFALACLIILRLLRKTDMATQALNLTSVTLLVILGVNALSSSVFPVDPLSSIGRLFRSTDGESAYAETSPLKDAAYTMFLPMVACTTFDMYKGRDEYSERYRNLWLSNMQAGSPTLGSKPDIYYIILDRYVRSDYLEEIYGFDNSEFIASLESRGFYVVDESRANYAYTVNSLASSLNFMHFDELTARLSDLLGFDSPKAHAFLAAMIRDSRVMSYLRNKGYTTTAFYTGFWFTEIEEADTYLEPPFVGLSVNEFQSGFLDLTPLAMIPVLQQTRDDAFRQRVLYPLEHIADAAADNAPTYVFAHIISPHDPYVFGANGEPAKTHGHYSYEEYLKAYSDQVAHINTRIVEVVDEILAQSPSPPIIIIQGDHGTCYGTASEFGPCMGERMSILNAYFFPDQDYSDLYDDITPANTFRIVFNRFFGTSYASLDDTSYYSRLGSLFIMTDVTDQVSGDE